jgi:hypothetical protein
MLVVFSPQILLSGLSVVLYGLLQAYRRFAAPALGPAVSSLVVISAYLAFAPADRDLPLSRLPVTAELILSVGTTLGVAALVAVAVWPTWRLHLTFRPRLRFPPGVARRAGGLALIGVIEIVAYDLSVVVASCWPTARLHRRGRPAELRLAGVQLGERRARAVRRAQRVPGAGRPRGAGVRPYLRRIHPGGAAWCPGPAAGPGA